MEQEAAKELIDCQSHEPLLVAVRGSARSKGDVAVRESNQPAVGNGDAMSVGAEKTQHMFRSAEGRLTRLGGRIDSSQNRATNAGRKTKSEVMVVLSSRYRFSSGLLPISWHVSRLPEPSWPGSSACPMDIFRTDPTRRTKTIDLGSGGSGISKAPCCRIHTLAGQCLTSNLRLGDISG